MTRQTVEPRHAKNTSITVVVVGLSLVLFVMLLLLSMRLNVSPFIALFIAVSVWSVLVVPIVGSAIVAKLGARYVGRFFGHNQDQALVHSPLLGFFAGVSGAFSGYVTLTICLIFVLERTFAGDILALQNIGIAIGLFVWALFSGVVMLASPRLKASPQQPVRLMEQVIPIVSSNC